MKLSCVLFLIPDQMYSGLGNVKKIIEDNNYFCIEYYISGDSSIAPEIEEIFNSIMEDFDEMVAVVYPSSTSCIVNSDFYGWQEKVDGKSYIEFLLEFFTKKNSVQKIDINMSATGVFDDTLGFFNSDESIARLILKEIKANEKLDA